MKKTLMGLLVLTFLSSTAFAGPASQGNGQGMQGGGKGQRMAQMQQNLGLSQEQMDQMRSIRENGGGRDEMRAVLTDGQRAKMDEHRAMRQGQGNRPRGNGQGNGQGNAQGNGQGASSGDSDG